MCLQGSSEPAPIQCFLPPDEKGVAMVFSVSKTWSSSGMSVYH